MHDGIQYDQIQCQGRGYEPFIVGNPWIFDICPSFLCHVTLKLAETSVAKSQPLVPYGANFLCLCFITDACLLL